VDATALILRRSSQYWLTGGDFVVPTEIDLRPLAEQIRPAIESGIASLLDELDDEPDVVSAVGIYFGIQGPCCVVQADNGHGLGRGYKRDSAGHFEANMADWHWYLDEFEFDGYGDFPHQEDLTVVGANGPIDPASGDAGLFKAVATIIRPTLTEYLPFDSLPRTKPFRVGIQPIGGRGEYWLLRNEPDATAGMPFDRWVAVVTR
jgi:hypothetical protein